MKRFVVQSPKVAFLTGHETRDIYKTGDRDYNQFAENQYFRYSLRNQGFDVVTLSLEDQEVPEDIDIVVIADMKTPFNEVENDRLNKYIARGGNLFILGDARRQEIMNPITEQMGVTFMSGTLVEMKENDSPSLIAGHITKERLRSVLNLIPVHMSSDLSLQCLMLLVWYLTLLKVSMPLR